MNIAIILAGGVGSRVGAEIPKQFVEVSGRPILAYTVEVFQNHPEIDAVEIVCVENYLSYVEEMVEKYKLSKVQWIVKGGADFQHSVMNGVSHLRGKVKEEDVVLVHYGCSPFVSDEIISDGIRVAAEKGNATSATPCFLLMGEKTNETYSSKWADRDQFMQLNSPQCFRFGYVDQLYREAEEKNLLQQVEPHTTSLMYLMGRVIYFSKGTQANIKITTKEDLELFKGYVMMKQSMR